MGGAIAAHVANAGVAVSLLDLAAAGDDRSALARGAIARMKKARPAPFMAPDAAQLVTVGNFEDDLELLAEADWICEAVVEKLAVKRDLYRRIDPARKPGSIVSSNTSTIPLARLIAGQSPAFAADFLVTHFFNPPRYMRLLEIVAGPATRPEAGARLAAFADIALGKDVVHCRDTPGFIANRIGIYWMTVAMSEALALGLTVEEADAIVGRPMGVPKTGIFGLADLTGIDLSPQVMRSMADLLPADDPFHAVYDEAGPLATLIREMVAGGYTGRKGKGGFYRLDTSGGTRVKQARDLASGAYRPVEKPRLASARARTLRELVSHPDKGGTYAWRVLAQTLSYVAGLVPEVTDDLASVDRAMKSGYAWKSGPFEQIDRLGVGWFAERLAAQGMAVPPLLAAADGAPLYREVDAELRVRTLEGGYRALARPVGTRPLADYKRARAPLAGNASASIWDIEDGVACLEFHSKMNAIDPNTMAMVRDAAKLDRQGFKALLVYNEGDNFSVGANIGLALFAANAAMWPLIEQTTKEGQDAFLALKYAPFPVVGAPSGMALGGGCEVLLHCDAVQAHAESYIGLVEVGVGFVPSWGGTKELLLRHLANEARAGGPMPAISAAFETIGRATVAGSAREAQKLLFLRPSDGVTMNRDRLLADAKERALAMVEGYRPPAKPEASLPGATARVALEMAVDGLVAQGRASAHDAVVAKALAGIVSGGDTDIVDTVSESDLLALERRAQMALVRTGPHARPSRAHAGDRQAAQELIPCKPIARPSRTSASSSTTFSRSTTTATCRASRSSRRTSWGLSSRRAPSSANSGCCR